MAWYVPDPVSQTVEMIIRYYGWSLLSDLLRLNCPGFRCAKKKPPEKKATAHLQSTREELLAPHRKLLFSAERNWVGERGNDVRNVYLKEGEGTREHSTVIPGLPDDVSTCGEIKQESFWESQDDILVCALSPKLLF